MTKRLLLLFLTISNVITSQNSSVSTKTIPLFSTQEIQEAPDTFTIHTTSINSPLSEIGSTFFMGKYIIYSSRKTGEIGAKKDPNTNEPYKTIYCTDIDKNGNLSHPYFFAKVLDSDGNETGVSFSPDENRIYYTKSDAALTQNYQLYKRKFDEVCRCRWIEEVPVSFNSKEYSIENPNVSPDGKKLYFSSNMPGGYGGYDLYVADIDENGIPHNPKNLGNEINTAGDEKFPYSSPVKARLYFSSNGHPGYGNLDLFVAAIKEDGFSSPLNLGKTINTSADEVAFILSSSTTGYFSSNRKGGKGSFDIYRFDLVKKLTNLNGLVFEKDSKIILPNTEVLLTNEKGEIISKHLTSKEGKFQFDIDPLESYGIKISKDGYLETIIPVNTNERNAAVSLALEQKKAEVPEKEIVIEKIYFDYNKAIIKKESTLSLNKIYNVLVENPEMKIIINAHTDSRGSNQYNQILSEKRAISALVYLTKKGIDKNRLNSKGYGETMPLSTCKDKCTEAEFEKDRRVEFIIVQ